MKYNHIPAIEYHGDRPCLPAPAYPVLWGLATNSLETKPSLWQRIKKALLK